MTQEDLKQVKDLIAKKMTNLTVKKTGDTPLEAFDLVNKNYITTNYVAAAFGRCHKTSTQSINNVSNTTVVWDTNDYATGITWDSANNRFKAKTAGKYLVSATVEWSAIPGAQLTQTDISILQNGSAVSLFTEQFYDAAGVVSLSRSITDIVNMALNDVVSIQVYQNSGGAVNLSTTNSFFNIFRVG